MMEYVELNQVVNLVSGFAIPSGDMVGDYAKVIKITNIKEDGSIDLDNTAGYCKPVAEKLSKYLLRDNDIIICMTGATIGKVAKASKVTGKYIVNQRVAIVRAKNKEEQNYYYHILSMPLFRRYTELVGYGAAQPNISLTQIGKFTFLHHASSRDRLIVSFVLSAYHNLIENSQKRIKLLEQMAENLYKEWFVRFRFPGYENTEFEGGLPKGWTLERLEDFGIVLETGSRPKGGIDFSVESGVPSLGAEAINGLAEFDYNNLKLVPQDYYDNMKRGKSKGNHICLSLKKVDSQQARNNVYLSNTEEGAVL